MMRRRLGSLLLIGSLSVFQSSFAEDGSWSNPILTQKFMAGFGGTFQVAETEAQFDADGVPGTGINFEDDLNFSEDDSNFFVKGMWRINPKHHISLEYFQVGRDGSVNLNKDITINGDVVSLGASAEAEFDTKFLRAGYGYSFINDGQKELGLNLGVHVAQVEFDFTAQGTINGVGGDTSVSEEETTLPLPNIGAHGAYAFNEKISLTARANAFYLAIDDYDGYLFDIAGDVVYSFNDNFGFAGGLQAYYINVQVDDGDFEGEFDYLLWGPRAYFYASF